MASSNQSGPLTGVEVVEFEGIGPGPLCGRMLAGMGASVTLVQRRTKPEAAARLGGTDDEPLNRGKRWVTIDLKDPVGRDHAFELVCRADALIEGNRPGVMERLGLGPDAFAQRNPKLVYGRMTGWGQYGPLAQTAGHDLNYVALTGMLALSAHRGETPIIPPTIVGDAAGALGLAFGIASALYDVARGGRGRVVDAAIVDIVAMLGGIAQCVCSTGQLGGEAPSAFHDSPFYDVYRCADGRFVTIGAIEPKFYSELLERLGLHDVAPDAQYDTALWPDLKKRMRAMFATRTRDYWTAQLEGTDVCFAPVLTLTEAAAHPHNQARASFDTSSRGVLLGAPAPRFAPLTNARSDDSNVICDPIDR